MSAPQVTLASASQIRAAVLRGAGVEFEVFSPGVDECAITTSPYSVADSDEEEEEEEEGEEEEQTQAKTPVRETRSEQKRTALRELWSGLTDWAGMGDDDEW